MTFERIVRPFQIPVSLNPVRLPLVITTAPGPDVVLTWGQAGNVPAGVAEGYSFNVKQLETYREVSRNPRTIRVKNPDDPSQHIDVVDTKEIKYQKFVQGTGPAPSKTVGFSGSTAAAASGFAGSAVTGGGAGITAAARFGFKDQPLAPNEEIIQVGPPREIPLDNQGGEVPL